MVVVFIIGVLFSIALPSFVRSREKTRAKACAGNLRRIQWAKDCYLMDKSLPTTATPTEEAIWGANSYLKEVPICPSGGRYDIRSGNEDPICTTGGKHNVNAEAIL